jgi:hypothetical protein
MMKIDINKRLSYLDVSKYIESQDEILLKEEATEGATNLVCKLKNKTIAFIKCHKNRIEYLRDKKAPDAILYENIDIDKWGLHIMEFKKTISTKSWEGGINQFESGLKTSLFLNGILDIRDQNIQKIIFYVAYRNDKLTNQIDINPVLSKQIEDNKKFIYWKQGKIKSVVSNSFIELKKIELSNDGSGSIEL